MSLAQAVEHWPDGTPRTSVALSADLSPELQTSVATFVPPPHQVLSLGRQGIRRTTAWLALRKPVHSIPTLDGPPAHPQFVRDRSDGPALLLECLQPGVTAHAHGTSLIVFPVLATYAAQTRTRSTLEISTLVASTTDRRKRRRECQFAECGAVPIQDTFDRITEVVDQMKTICHLHRVRRSAGCSLSVGGTSVTRDALDARVSVQPMGQARGRPIREQFDGSAPISIDQDRAIGVPTPLAPVIDAQHTG
jgi:hypothetical protein